MIISLIAAVAQNRVIGRNNDLAWYLPRDMKYFMQTTKGHYVVMGRKNYESIPDKYRPLKDRTSIVITRQQDYNATGCLVVNSIEDALQIASTDGEKEVFIIGGGEIYAQTIPFADRLYLTEIKAEFDGDTYFPEPDWTLWKEKSRIENLPDEKHEVAFDFVIYERKN